MSGWDVGLVESADIAAAGTEGSAVAIVGELVGVFVGSATSCDLTVEVSVNGTDFVPLYLGDVAAPAVWKLAGTTGNVFVNMLPVGGAKFLRFKSSVAQASGVSLDVVQVRV